VDRRTLGRAGEEAAAAALIDRGYVVLRRNVRTRWGEIDLVAAQGGEIVFVEVKTRTTAERGRPLDAIHPGKQRRLARLALAFISARGLHRRPCRFDAVAVTLTTGGRVVDVEIVPNAFEVPSG
jgi:putative endonuclease